MRIRSSISCLVATIPFIAFATEPTPKPETIVVSGTRTHKNASDLPTILHRISSDQLVHHSSRNLIDSIRLVPGILGQKTAHGQGSPFMRGFTGFRTLYLMDGIRLNNSILRGGPNEYSGLIDSYAIEQVEVVKGPNSVLYGSDAVGGSIAVRPIQADLYQENPHRTRIMLRRAEAEDSMVGRISYQGRLGSSTAFHLGVTGKKFGDIRPGGSSSRLEKTGYNEHNFDASIAQKLLGGELLAYWQSAAQNDVWRTHSTIYGQKFKGTSIGSDLKRAKDLSRQLAYLRYTKNTDSILADRVEMTLSYQELYEQQTRIRNDDRRDTQDIAVYTKGVQLQLDKTIARHELSYGIEIFEDWVRSSSVRFAADGSLQSVGIQGPVADQSSYTQAGLYFQNIFAWNQRTSLTAGIRHNLAVAELGRYEDPLLNEAASSKDSFEKTVAQLKGIYSLDDNGSYRIFAAVAEAFRAPNLSDLSRLDDGRSNVLEVPSDGLEAEEFINYELGLKINLANVYSQLAFYHTSIKKMIDLKPKEITDDGQILTDKRNISDGYAQGIEFDVLYWVSPQFSFKLFHTQMTSSVATYPDTTELKQRSPLSRTQPAATQLMTSFHQPDYRISLILHRSEAQRKLSFVDQQDLQRIPPGGSDGFQTTDMSVSYRLSQMSSESWLNLTIENLSDEAYRVHGSGQNEVGRNFIASVDARL